MKYISFVLIQLLLSLFLCLPCTAKDEQEASVGAKDGTIRDKLKDGVSNRKLWSQGVRSLCPVRMLHGPCVRDLQYSKDGSVLFSLSESIRIWDSQSGLLLRSVVGPTKFQAFCQLANGNRIATIDHFDHIPEPVPDYYGVPRHVPTIQLWGIEKDANLAISKLKVPLNVSRADIIDMVSSTDLNIIFIMVSYSKDLVTTGDSSLETDYDQVQHILGYHGDNLKLLFDKRLDEHYSSMHWSSESQKLLLQRYSGVASFDPHTRNIDWSQDRKGITSLLFSLPSDGIENGPECALIQSTWDDIQQHMVLDVDYINIASGELKHSSTHKYPSLWLDTPTEGAYCAYNVNDKTRSIAIPSDRTLSSLYTNNLDEYDTRRYCCDCDDTKIITMNDAGNMLAFSIPGQREIYIYDTGNLQQVCAPHGYVTAISKGAKGTIGASMNGSQIYIFNIASIEEQSISSIIIPHKHNVYALALSNNERYLAIGGMRGTVSVWDLIHNKILGRLSVSKSSDPIISVAFNDNDISAIDGRANVWKWKLPLTQEDWGLSPIASQWPQTSGPDNNALHQPNKNDRGLLRMGSNICNLSANGKVAVTFYPFPEQIPNVFPGEKMGQPGASVVVRHDLLNCYTTKQQRQSYIYEFFEETGSFRVFNSKGIQDRLVCPTIASGHVVNKIKVTNGGRYILFITGGGEVIITDIKENVITSMIKTDDSELVDAVFLPDDHILLTASWRDTISAWNSKTSQQIWSKTVPDCRHYIIEARKSLQSYDVFLGTRDSGVLTFSF